MKFLIKSLGWDGWRAAYDTAYAEVLAEGGARLPFDPEAPPAETAPDWPRLDAPDLGAGCRTRGGFAGGGPRASCRRCGPACRSARKPDCGGSARTCARRSSRASRSSPRPCRSVISPANRCASSRICRSPSATAPSASRPTRTSCSAGCRSVTSRPCTSTSRPPASRCPMRAPLPTSPAARARSRAASRSPSHAGSASCSAITCASAPHLVDAAPDVHIKISGCPNGCGQHHVAGIGFQGSIRKIAGRPVPQYFVMVGGDAGRDGARFARLAAKIPARRGPEALERLLALYTAERTDGETATAFFGRVELPRLKQVLPTSNGWRLRTRCRPTSSISARTRRSRRKCSTASAVHNVSGRAPMTIPRGCGRLQACRCRRPGSSGRS